MQRSRPGLNIHAVVLAGTLLAVPLAGHAADPKYTGTHHGTAGATVNPKQFVKEAAAGGMAEVKLGQLAQQKAASADVKAFGKRMEDDHTKVNGELKQLAADEKVTLPDGLDSKHQALYDRLSKLSGPQFDKTYMTEMVRDHQQDVAEFQKAARSDNAQVKDFASRTLPTLEDHLREAQQIASNEGHQASR
jgi:putative membrane protein